MNIKIISETKQYNNDRQYDAYKRNLIKLGYRERPADFTDTPTPKTYFESYNHQTAKQQITIFP